ncbi:MAG: hypothetical protein JSS39_03610 [Nitrospira sp.]|nr:hypothetical protein [Nitrospira sp.]
MERLDQRAIEFLERWPLADCSIVEHRFTPYMRDYDVIIETTAAAPDDSGSYLEGRYRFRFTHCVLAKVTSTVTDMSWTRSWDDQFTDYDVWQESGEPEGYVWGVNYMNAYPGAQYLPNSEAATEWSRRLEHQMHEVQIDTNAHLILLIFHRLLLHKLAQGDYTTRVLSDIEPYEMLG